MKNNCSTGELFKSAQKADFVAKVPEDNKYFKDIKESVRGMSIF
jgi:hypothetical protein